MSSRSSDRPKERPSPLSLSLLIVEDEMMVAWQLADMIHTLGHRACGSVGTQEKAIEAAARLKPDGILMDYRLAGRGNGLVAARRIREVADVPIVFCTAYAGFLEAMLQSLPNTRLISKPIRTSCLQGALGHLFGSNGIGTSSVRP
jgi:CheY-like chemotaxis protein